MTAGFEKIPNRAPASDSVSQRSATRGAASVGNSLPSIIALGMGSF